MRALSPSPLRPLLGLILALAIPSTALAQAPSPAPPKPVAADPALDAARAAFEALPEGERRALQEALIWTGDYTGIVDGGFGRQTFEGLAAFQRRSRQTATGILDPKAQGALRAAAREARAAAGFTVVEDARSGVRIGVPERLLVKRDANANGGTRWQSADDKVTLDTRSLADPPGGLQGLFDRNVAIQTPGRQVTYKVLRPDFFVIAGETPTGKFYTRYATGEGGLRGFSLGYDKALAPEVDRLVVAIANSFTPFPNPVPAGTASAVAAKPPAPAAPSPVPAGAPQTLAAKPATPATPPPPGMAVPSGPAPAGGASRVQPPGLLGTGLLVEARLVATTVPETACAGLRAAGRKPRQVRREGGLTLLEFDEPVNPSPLQPAAGPAAPGTPLLVLAYGRQGQREDLVVTPALADEGGTIAAPLQTGARGAAVFDLSGALRGLVLDSPDERRMVAGVTPPARYRLDASALGRLPKGEGSPAEGGAQRSTAEIASAVRGNIVAITCLP